MQGGHQDSPVEGSGMTGDWCKLPVDGPAFARRAVRRAGEGEWEDEGVHRGTRIRAVWARTGRCSATRVYAFKSGGRVTASPCLSELKGMIEMASAPEGGCA